ncbi:cytochrome P450 [Dacryopinax primogenitus]|uniref:Cytochrome P450 n=1 Tax=Dacryopinax primogenitus (strain DJM 731) TaxID=1858805 RepID=M5G4P0_DACPD|nr:cytochrome P450 [Dacryopinax primogenitus]EJU05216.1 cytochrome P450 [Dacryopinax primogenitus]
MPKFMHPLRVINKQYEADIKLMFEVVDEVIAHRKTHPLTGSRDLLSLMLEGKDFMTGRGLSDTNIRYQLLTFLAAGHETTSGLLSFALYHLLSNPQAYAALQKEVDTVLSDNPLTVDHLSKLPYTNAVLRETLRLNSPALGMVVTSFNHTELLCGEYEVRKGWPLLLDFYGLHRDPAVWGDDAESFRPERMLDDKINTLPPNSWKPFGNGARGCIGRALALQESVMMLATLFQRFEIRFDDPSYRLQLKETITTKPTGFKIHAIPRAGKKVFGAANGYMSPGVLGETLQKVGHTAPGKGAPLLVLFGTDSGTCERFAEQIASDAVIHGFNPKIGAMDSVEDVANLPRDAPVIILTSSREGQPPENAVRFVQALKEMTATTKPLQGVKYAVFGAGNHDWVRSFYRIPKLVDSRMEELGAERLIPRGEGDAGGANVYNSFDAWEKALWSAVSKDLNDAAPEAASELDIEDDLIVAVVGATRDILLRQPDLTEGKCVENRVLTASDQPVKRHIEFQLPLGMEYQTGDYLAVLPLNSPESVHRVLAHFNVLGETKIVITSRAPTTLPTNEPVSLQDLFSGYVELAQPMSQRNLDEVMRYAPVDGPERQALDKLVANPKTDVFDKHLSVLDLLEQHPSVKIPLAQFIKLLPSMRIRRYSISSSSLWKKANCTLTFSVIRGSSTAGKRDFLGVASNYLANLMPGERNLPGCPRASRKTSLMPFSSGVVHNALHSLRTECI